MSRLILYGLLLLALMALGAQAAKVPSSTVVPKTLCTDKSNCSCHFLDVDETVHKIDCQHLSYQSMPLSENLPKKVAEINMNLNLLRELQQLESNEDLLRLILTTNDLSKLSPSAFEHTPHLIFIDFSYNVLKTVPEIIFDKLKELQFLNLSHNSIETLPKHLFRNTEMLAELRLSYNPLKHLDPELFQGLNELYLLDLSGCEIFSLPSNVFQGLPSLADLDLSKNDFENVPNHVLRFPRHLQRLDLSKNPIKLIDENSFKGLWTIRKLIMNQMPNLYQIGVKAFSDLWNLEEVFIEDNAVLSYIDDRAFVGTFNRTWMAIKVVSFRRNHLAFLKERTLPFCNLTFLDLRENPWDCNCHLHWLKYCHGKSEFERGLICAQPDRLRGHSLDAIEQKQLVCTNIEEIHTRYGMLLLATVIFFVGIIIVLQRDKIASFFTNRKNNGPIYYVRANEGEF